MSYEEAVASAAAALTRGEDANWELARLTHENTIKGGGRQTSDGLVSMARWCGDVRQVSGRKFSLRTGGLYKAVWEANSASLAELPSFSEALREASPTSYVQPERPQREPEGTGVPSEPERLVTTTPLTPLTLVPVDETDDMPPLVRYRDQPGGDPVGESLERNRAISDLEKALVRIPSTIGPILERLQAGVNFKRVTVLGLASGMLFLPGELARARAALDAVEVLLRTGRPPQPTDEERRDGTAR